MKITKTDGKLNVPDNPTIPFIEGDGVGAEITPVMQAVVNAAVEKAYHGKRQIEWKEVLAGGNPMRRQASGFYKPRWMLSAGSRGYQVIPCR